MSRLVGEKVVFQFCREAVLETFDDGALILDVKELAITELNATARDILACTDGRKTAGQVAGLLAEKYAIKPALALQDVLALYEQLRHQGIVEETERSRKELADGKSG